ncbi:MAG TPA: hypothetical protein VK622_03635 [Puia sp.]|nr:hypothetical protein [Puia sp.]
MILNKFSSVSLSGRLKVLSLQILALSLFSCNKTANINANKAFVSFTHLAYNVGPLTLLINDDTLFSAIPFDSATGHPYATVTSRISNTSIFENKDSFLTGFSSFRQGAYYSIYIYDTLNGQTKSMIILQDSPPLNSDTTISIRYMNFTPSSLIGLLLVNTRHSLPVASDTIVISPENFVGFDINPAAYTFRPIVAGTYNITAFTDSARPAPDNHNFRYMGKFGFSIISNYNFNLFGFWNDTTSQYRLQFKPVPLN